MRLFSTAILLILLPGLTLAAGGAQLVSPSSGLKLIIDVDEAGRPVYAVSLDGEAVILESRLGLRFAKGRDFDAGMRMASVRHSSVDTTWEQPWGERRAVHDRHHELLVEFRSADEADVAFLVRVRAFDDGVGFRYEVPLQDAGPVDVVDELTEFRVPPKATAWWQPGDDPFKYETLYRETPVAGMGKAHSPLTLRLPSGIHVSLHEAALLDYPAYTLEPTGPGVLKTTLRPWSDGTLARVRAPFTSPWRTVQVSRNAIGLTNSDLILNLNEPNRLGNVDWVAPGKYVGIWWAIHLGRKTWEQGPDHGATTAEAKRYIDFAAEHGFDGVLLEGWNVGWGEGEAYSFLESTADLDLAGVAAYAAENGVSLIGHHETFGDIPAYEAVMGEAFDLYESLGIGQVKTGYVGSAGSLRRIDDEGNEVREWHDSQYAVRHHVKVLEEAARRRISVNTHEPVKDTGLRRTYPNWLTREGARGQEFAVWGETPNPPDHIPTLAFTRMLAGPLDFTPGLFQLTFDARGNARHVSSTLARQLALYVVLYSPVHMAPDLFEHYEKHADAFAFIVDVPTDWEESMPIDGEVGEFIVMARKARGADDWFVGAVTDERSRALQVPLRFLDQGRKYVATIYADGEDADWQSNPHDYTITEKTVDRDSVLGLNLAAGGGVAIRLRPAHGGTE
jgi:alpha-glucosidase